MQVELNALIKIAIIFLEIEFKYVIHLLKSLYNLCAGIKEKNISGQIALVTGGGNGLGKQISTQLAKHGCNVIIVDIDENAANELSKNLQETYNIKSKAYKVDIGSYDEIQELAKKIEIDIGPVDILVNNAGLMPISTLDEINPTEVKKVFAVNLISHFWTTQTFLVGMKKRNRGHIVAICSLAGMSSLARCIAYATTKHGLKGFMDCLTTELVIENSDVKTTTVFPNFINTNPKLMDILHETNTFHGLPPMSPSYVAKRIVQGILKNEEHIVIPGFYAIFAYFTNVIPKYVWAPTVYKSVQKTVLRITK